MITIKLFTPKQVYLESEALDYPLGIKIYEEMKAVGVPVLIINSHNRLPHTKVVNPQQSYREGKQTLVVGVKKTLRLTSCKPSADYEFSIATGCPGSCQYCYLQTHLGKKPYIRVYVNVDEILNKVNEITNTNLPRITTFEAASSSDPLAVEHLTGSLTKTIDYFANLKNARLRVVSKFAAVEPLLNIKHNGHTKFRFSLNTQDIITGFEQNTASLTERITAAGQLAQAQYPLGFIIAPLFIYPSYETAYQELFKQLAASLPSDLPSLTFELITHRFTKKAKNIILERFPNTGLDLDETNRRRKYGQYGLIKYIYPAAEYLKLKTTITQLINQFFPNAEIEYFT